MLLRGLALALRREVMVKEMPQVMEMELAVVRETGLEVALARVKKREDPVPGSVQVVRGRECTPE